MATELPINRVLTKEELSSCLQRSNTRALVVLIGNYAIIAFAFALTIVWPNPLTILISVLLLGARQLGLEVLNHDCAHGVFFSNRRVNELVGHWLCGGPVNTNLYRYRDYHLQHHRHAGTEKDPDLALALTYPARKDSVRRKVLRDLSGRTGIRDTWRQLRKMRPLRNAPFLITHVVMISVLTASGAPWAYLLWWGGYFFVYPLVTRLRFMGEHGVALDRLSRDARENTATTLVSGWERILIAPNFVNYHLEHHLLAGVPCYHLAKFHRLLAERDYFGDIDCITRGYANVLRKATLPA